MVRRGQGLHFKDRGQRLIRQGRHRFRFKECRQQEFLDHQEQERTEHFGCFTFLNRLGRNQSVPHQDSRWRSCQVILFNRQGHIRESIPEQRFLNRQQVFFIFLQQVFLILQQVFLIL